MAQKILHFTLRLINGRAARFPVDTVAIRLTPDGHGVDQQFCPGNQSLRARYQGKIAGHPGRSASDIRWMIVE